MPRSASVFPHLLPAYGGIGPAVATINSCLQRKQNWSEDLHAFCERDEMTHAADAEYRVNGIWPLDRWRWVTDSRLRTDLRQALSDVQIVHIHGMWQVHTIEACKAATKRGIPCVISAHGMFDRWALEHHGIRKRLYSLLFQDRVMHRAVAWRALTDREEEDIRSLGYQGTVKVIPNCVIVPDQIDVADFYAAAPTLRGRKLIVFLGRIQAKKNVIALVRAWHRIYRAHPDCHVVIVGPESDLSWSECATYIADNGLGAHVTKIGCVSGRVKWACLAAACVHVLPSFSEGLSMSVLEGLAMGIPTIATTGSNCSFVAAAGAGIIVSSSVSDLAEAMTNLLSISHSERSAMVDAAKSVITRSYTPEVVAAGLAELYRAAI